MSHNLEVGHKPRQKSIENLHGQHVVGDRIKFWEEKIDWRHLKGAKEFETGVGDTMYRKGALTGWTDDQIQVLQDEMERMVAQARDDDSKNAESNLKTPEKQDDTETQAASLQNMDQLAVTEVDSSKHRRTRTANLRARLEEMQAQLTQVTTELDETQNDLSKKESEISELQNEAEQQKLYNASADSLQQQLQTLQESLRSAQTDLEQSDEQIVERDNEIDNLKDEIQTLKDLNKGLSESTQNFESSDDAMKKSVQDANRFGTMLSAMHEQLEFEREQFLQKIQKLEQEIELRNKRLTTMFQLYNDLVQKTKKKKKQNDSKPQEN